MGRTIKFRGKDLKTGEWRYGFYTQGARVDHLFGEERKRHIIYSDTLYDINPETVGQHTGLKDKNGKEIYEGDIVECVSWNENFSNPKTGEVMQPFRRKMVVEFRNGGFKMVETMPYGIEQHVWDIIYNGDIEVIGIIHETNDLKL